MQEQDKKQMVSSNPDVQKDAADNGTDLNAATQLNGPDQNGTDLNAQTVMSNQSSADAGTNGATMVNGESDTQRIRRSDLGDKGTDLNAPTTLNHASGLKNEPAASSAQQPKAPAPVPRAEDGEDPLVGQTMGPARLTKKLGQGGMGMVYLGEHTSLQKKVAVKLLPAHLAEKSQEYVERFRREAVAAGRLEQENIVQVFDVNKSGDYWYIIMQFVEGTDLRDLVKEKGKLDLNTAAGYMLQVARGLQAAHKADIVHRDIKPENIMLTKDGICKVADFGLAGLGDSNLTRTGQTMGSPYYMSPEQCAGEVLDIRTDIYALGVTFYYLLTAEHPYTGETPVEIMHKHTTAEIPSPSSLDNSIPESASLVIRRMMAKKKEMRYDNPEELIADLEALIEKPDMVPVGAMKARPPIISRTAGLAIAAALFVLTMVLLFSNNGMGPGGGGVMAAPSVTVAGVTLPLPPKGSQAAVDDWSTPLRVGALLVDGSDASAREKMQVLRLQSSLAKEGMIAVDRDNLDKILTELALAKTDLTDADKRVQLGKLFNSHYFFKVGLEAKEPNAEGIINVTISVTSTSEMLDAAMAEVKTDAKGNFPPEQLAEMAKQISQTIVDKYGIRGRVKAVPTADKVVLNIGRFAGVADGQQYKVLNDKDAQVAVLEVIHREDDTANAKIVEGDIKTLRKGDRVEWIKK